MGPRNKEKGWRSEAKGKKNIGRMEGWRKESVRRHALQIQ